MTEPTTTKGGVIANLIKDAIAYRDQRAQFRIEAMEYFAGTMRDVPHEDGRSKVVSLDVREAVKKVLPSAVRTILGAEKVVEYQPTKAGTDEQSKQATDFVNLVILPECEGYEAISDAMRDALLLRNGVLRWWCEEKQTVRVSTHTGLDDAALAQLVADDDVEVLQYSSEALEPGKGGAEPSGTDGQGEREGAALPPTSMGQPKVGQPPPVTLHDVKIKRRETTREIRVAAVAPDEWLIHPDALTIDEALICGVMRRYRRADLVALGYDRKRVTEAADAGVPAVEEQVRRDVWINRTEQERMLGEVDYYEVYARIDADEDGVPELRRYVLIGGTGEESIFEDDYWDEAPFATIISERQPHQWEGKSLADDVMPIQRIKTVLLRQTLDNLYWQNMPQPIVQDGAIHNPDAFLKPEFGKPIRIRQGADARAAVAFNLVPFVAEKSFAMLDYMDRVVTDRTGVSDASSGLDPDALQNVTAKATALVESAGVAQTELMIRTMAVGLRRFFRGLLRLVIQHQDRPRTVQLRGQWVEFDPRSWDADMDATVNVGLGAGTRERDMMMMQIIIGLQEKLLASLGPMNNPFVTPDNVHAAITQMTAAAGIKSPSLFFTKPDQMRLQQRMQAEQNKPSPEQEKAQGQIKVEQVKAAAAMQIEQGKAAIGIKLKEAEIAAQRDKEEAQMQADLRVKLAEIEKNAKAEAAKAMAQAESDARKMAFEREKMAAQHRLDLQKMAVQVMLAQGKASGQASVDPETGEVVEREVPDLADGVGGAIGAIQTIAAHIAGEP